MKAIADCWPATFHLQQEILLYSPKLLRRVPDVRSVFACLAHEGLEVVVLVVLGQDRLGELGGLVDNDTVAVLSGRSKQEKGERTRTAS